MWAVRGPVRHFTLFFADIATRRAHIAGTTANPTPQWMEQTARNVTDGETGRLRHKAIGSAGCSITPIGPRREPRIESSDTTGSKRVTFAERPYASPGERDWR